jgi:hypothetical protein
MNKSLVLYITGMICVLAIGVLIGSFFSMPNMFGSSSNKISAYPIELSSTAMHTHMQKEVPPGINPPVIRMDVIEDPMKKRNFSLHLITENFRFAPETVSMKPVFGEGHAHLYIDDILICRIYGPWHHIPTLKPGRHIIYVTLNLNNHDEYMVNKNTIGAKTAIIVK